MGAQRNACGPAEKHDDTARDDHSCSQPTGPLSMGKDGQKTDRRGISQGKDGRKGAPGERLGNMDEIRGWAGSGNNGTQQQSDKPHPGEAGHCRQCCTPACKDPGDQHRRHNQDEIPGIFSGGRDSLCPAHLCRGNRLYELANRHVSRKIGKISQKNANFAFFPSKS